MAPPVRYRTPAEQMGDLALEARARGMTFEEWWEESVRVARRPITVSTPLAARPPACVLWPTDSGECRAWRAAIAESEEAWRRAYERLPATPGEVSLARLRPVLKQLLAA